MAKDLSPTDLPGLVLIAQSDNKVDHTSITRTLSPFAQEIAEVLIKGPDDKPSQVIRAANQIRYFATAH